jgi:hypothetical protein
LPFFSGFTLACAGLGLCFAAGFGEAFATSIFLGFGFGIGVFSFGAGVGVPFAGVAVAVGFGVPVPNSISLFALVTTGFSSAASSRSGGLDSVALGGCFSGCDACFSDSSTERSLAPPNQTMLSGFDEALAATLQRIRTVISAMCASAIRTTFRQNDFTPLNH